MSLAIQQIDQTGFIEDWSGARIADAQISGRPG